MFLRFEKGQVAGKCSGNLPDKTKTKFYRFRGTPKKKIR